jgi:hypothetical protein
LRGRVRRRRPGEFADGRVIETRAQPPRATLGARRGRELRSGLRCEERTRGGHPNLGSRALCQTSRPFGEEAPRFVREIRGSWRGRWSRKKGRADDSGCERLSCRSARRTIGLLSRAHRPRWATEELRPYATTGPLGPCWPLRTPASPGDFTAPGLSRSLWALDRLTPPPHTHSTTDTTYPRHCQPLVLITSGRLGLRGSLCVCDPEAAPAAGKGHCVRQRTSFFSSFFPPAFPTTPHPIPAPKLSPPSHSWLDGCASKSRITKATQWR